MNRIVDNLIATCFLVLLGCEVAPGSTTNPSTTTDRALEANTAALLSAENVNSARRDPSRDWKEYLEAHKRMVAQATSKGLLAAGSTQSATVYDSRVATTSANFSNVPVWSDSDINAQFKVTRNSRFMHATSDANFIRRASWLYPDDGCFARAELATSMIGDEGKVKPYKLFSFGNLVVSTNNSPSGSVSWWYHVVPVVKSASSGEVYVFDPAIDPSQPLAWQTWLLRQVTSLANVQVTVADSNAYAPSSPVTGGTNQRTSALSSMQSSYLGAEWSRQSALGRDPVLVLGDFAPWAAVVKDYNQDRTTDIVWHQGSTGITQVWFMSGVTMSSQAQVDPRYLVPDSSGWRFAGTGDFNGDGKTDILWHNGGTGATQAWFMDGVTMASQAQVDPRYLVPDSSGWLFAGTGDFNYDGQTDILWHNGGTGATVAWYMDGITMTSQAQVDPRYPVPDSSGWRFAGTGDFNHDGKVDILWHNGGTGATQAWFMDGVTMTSQAQVDPRYPVPDSSGWLFDMTGDFNGDGKVDILWHNGSTGATQAWFMDGVTMTSQAQVDPRYLVPDSSGWLPAGN
jgi:hypothetical protein